MKLQKGFTLIEIMVVIIILGMLAGLVLPRILGQEEKAKIETAKVQIRSLESALDAFKLDNGFYPETEQGSCRADQAARDRTHSIKMAGRRIPEACADPEGPLGQGLCLSFSRQ